MHKALRLETRVKRVNFLYRGTSKNGKVTIKSSLINLRPNTWRIPTVPDQLKYLGRNSSFTLNWPKNVKIGPGRRTFSCPVRWAILKIVEIKRNFSQRCVFTISRVVLSDFWKLAKKFLKNIQNLAQEGVHFCVRSVNLY